MFQVLVTSDSTVSSSIDFRISLYCEIRLPPEDTITGDLPNYIYNKAFREIGWGERVSSFAITPTKECSRSFLCWVNRIIDMLLPGNNDSSGIMWKLDCRAHDESLCSRYHQGVTKCVYTLSIAMPVVAVRANTAIHTLLSIRVLIYAQEGEYIVQGVCFKHLCMCLLSHGKSCYGRVQRDMCGFAYWPERERESNKYSSRTKCSVGPPLYLQPLDLLVCQ